MPRAARRMEDVVWEMEKNQELMAKTVWGRKKVNCVMIEKMRLNVQTFLWIPLFLWERLLPHSQVLLVFHQPEKRRARFDSQPIIVVFRITPNRKTNVVWLLFLKETNSIESIVFMLSAWMYVNPIQATCIVLLYTELEFHKTQSICTHSTNYF